MSTPVRFVQTPAIALYSPMASTDASAVVAPYPLDLDGVKLTMTDFGTVAYMTVDPKVSGFEEIISFTGIVDNGNNTATLIGLTRDLQSKYPYTGSGTGKSHGSSALVVFSDNPQVYAAFGALANDNIWVGQQTFTSFPITPATPLASATVAGMSKLSVAPANALIPIAVGVNDTSIFAPIGATMPTGATIPFDGLVTPSGWLPADASAVSRATYPALWAALHMSGTFTVTIASPAVFTATAHGLSIGNRIRFTTTGGLPSGLAINTDYYIIATGFGTNAFEVSLSPGGTAVNTTGSQSGVQTWFYAPHGHGDGSTTFNVPDRRGRAIVGSGSGVKTAHIISIASNVITADLSVANGNEFQTGEAVVFTAIVPGNLTTATTYYVVRTGNNTFSLATSLSNAQGFTSTGSQNPSLITLAGTETGSFAIALSVRTVGDTGGEEAHSLRVDENASHNHQQQSASGGSGSWPSTTPSSGPTYSSFVVNSSGSNNPANIMQPFGVSNYIIKT